MIKLSGNEDAANHMTYTTTATHVTDEHGNRATLERWETVAGAKRALATLVGCICCTDCAVCADCTDCADCTRCTSCAGCARCADCTDCADCTSCTSCARCARCAGCAGCTGCAGCLECTDCIHDYVHGTMGGYGWWVDPETGRARVGCQERDDWEHLTRAQVAAFADDAGEWYDRYYAAWLSIIAVVVGSASEDAR